MDDATAELEPTMSRRSLGRLARGGLARAARPVRGLAKRLPLTERQRARSQELLFTRLHWLLRNSTAYKVWRKEQLHAGVAYGICIPEIADGGPAVLLVSHNKGGGTAEHVAALAGKLGSAGVRVLSLRRFNAELAEIVVLAGTPKPAEVVRMRDVGALETALRDLGVAHIHVHHTFDIGRTVPTTIRDVAARMRIEYDFTIHDFFAVCPRFHFFDARTGAYCGEPPPTACVACVDRSGSVLGRKVDVAEWRAAWKTFVEGARIVFAPSESAASTALRYFPSANLRVRPHFDLPATSSSPHRAPHRIAVVGAIGPEKGSRILVACAASALMRHPDLSFTLIGFSDRDHILRRLRNVTITGPYASDDLPLLLAESGCSIAFFPGVVPETYSFTLSSVFASGLFPIAFDIGALAERIHKQGWGRVLPSAMAFSPDEVADVLASTEVPPTPPAFVAAAYEPFLETYYELDVGDLEARYPSFTRGNASKPPADI